MEDLTVTYGRYAGQLPAAGVTLEEVYRDLGRSQSATARYKYVHALLWTSDLLPDAVPPKPRRQSDESPRAPQIDDGMRCLADGVYSEAFHLYTGSVVESPPGTVDHARALLYRSVALYQMGLYEQCADDLDRALRSVRLGPALPDTLWFDVLYRYGLVMEKLGRRVEMSRCFDRGLDVMNRMVDRGEMTAERSKEIACRMQRVASNRRRQRRPLAASQNRDDPWPYVAGARHALCSAFTKHVEFRQTPGMGLGLFTTRDLEPGDVVGIEDSHIGIPLEDNYYICCYSDCQKPNMVVYFCTNCTLVYYCSESCLVKDREEGGHNYECPILHAVRNLPGNKIFNQLALKWFLRESTKMGLDEYCSTVTLMSENNLNLFTRKSIKNGQYNNFVSAYSMDIDSASTKRLLFLNCVVVEMLHYLLLSGYQIPVHYLPTVGASLVHMIQVIEQSYKMFESIKPYYTNRNHDGSKLVDMGFSIYPSLNQINHSCDPNIMIRHLIDKRTIVLTASRPIPKDSQLFINYGKHFYHHDKEERCLYLQQNFNFQCCCQACNEDWPMYSNLLRTLDITQILKSVKFDENNAAEFMRKFLARDCEFKICMNMRSNLFKFIKLCFTHSRRPCIFFEQCQGHILRVNELRLIDTYCYELLVLVNSLHGLP